MQFLQQMLKSFFEYYILLFCFYIPFTFAGSKTKNSKNMKKKLITFLMLFASVSSKELELMLKSFLLLANFTMMLAIDGMLFGFGASLFHRISTVIIVLTVLNCVFMGRRLFKKDKESEETKEAINGPSV